MTTDYFRWLTQDWEAARRPGNVPSMNLKQKEKKNLYPKLL